MTQTITRLFDSYDTALRAMLGLKDAGFTDREVSLLSNRHTPAAASDTSSATLADTETGAEIGGVLGAAAGLMAGFGVIAIPGIGPVVAAGWLASTLAIGAAGAVAGGATGGLVNALIGGGTPEEEAQVYAEGVRRGDSLVTVRVPDERATEATLILSRYDTATSLPDAHEAGRSEVDADQRVPAGNSSEPILPAGLPTTPPH